MELESVDCPICGPSQTVNLLRVRDIKVFGPGEFQLVRCQGCSLVYINPRPTPGAMAPYYPPRYWAPPPEEGARPYTDAGMRRALALLSREFPGGRVLDVGCGVGTMPALMRERGLKAMGVEPYERAAQIARERYGLEIVCSFLQEAELPPESFDGITFFDVLEHVHDPVGDLRKAFSLLRPGGMVFVKAPNIEALQAGLFGKWWYGLDVPRHLFHFSPRSLRRALEVTGFRPIEVRAVPDPVGAIVFEISVVYWLRGLQLAHRGVTVAPTEDQTVGEVLQGQVYAAVPSVGKRAFRWVARNLLYAPLAVENLVGRSAELIAIGRRPKAEDPE